jgi:hypothetical protein
MIFALLQIAAFAVIALCLYRWRAAVRRRNAQSWDQLVARLRPDLTTGEDGTLQRDPSASPEEQWQRVRGAHGLWAMYENARVMLEMADFAARNSETVDRELLASLRSDAMQIRVSVLMALTRYAFSQVNEGICVNALNAAAMYRDMAGRTRAFLEANGSGLVPNMAGAM